MNNRKETLKTILFIILAIGGIMASGVIAPNEKNSLNSTKGGLTSSNNHV